MRRGTFISSVRSDSLGGFEGELIDGAVLAIYFDPEDPTNIVECYTFTFSYQTDAEGNKVRHPLCFPSRIELIFGEISTPSLSCETR